MARAGAVILKSFISVYFLLTLFGCGGSNLTGTYVAEDATAAMLVDIAEGSNGEVTGSVALAYPDYENSKVTIETASLTGTRNGEQLNLMSQPTKWGTNPVPFNAEIKGSDLVVRTVGTRKRIELKRADEKQYLDRLAYFESDANPSEAEIAARD